MSYYVRVASAEYGVEFFAYDSLQEAGNGLKRLEREVEQTGNDR